MATSQMILLAASIFVSYNDICPCLDFNGLQST